MIQERERTTLEPLQWTAQALEREVARVIVGQRAVVRGVTIALLCGGHVLLEGLPGLGKTALVRAFARALQLKDSRIQFTPDLMPADIVGTNVLFEGENGRRTFEFQPGPIFANLVLADEINRATPKTQAALLEAMQEGRATVGTNSHDLPRPFFVLATQNPIELEGTYPLPEAELDRFFFKLNVPFPSRQDLSEIVRRTTGALHEESDVVADASSILELQALARQVPIASYVEDYAVRLVLATHPDLPEGVPAVRTLVRYGASPRAAQAIVLGAKVAAALEGRLNVSFGDVRLVAPPALRHRLVLSYEADTQRVTADQVIAQVVAAVPEKG